MRSQPHRLACVLSPVETSLIVLEPSLMSLCLPWGKRASLVEFQQCRPRMALISRQSKPTHLPHEGPGQRAASLANDSHHRQVFGLVGVRIQRIAYLLITASQIFMPIQC
jgi:hypothetical protein